MKFWNYAAACGEFGSELKSSLTTEDVNELRADCVSLGDEGWLRWVLEHSELIAAYIAATPSQRRTRKAWNNPVLRRRLVLASFLHVHRAWAVLKALDDSNLEPGKSYRDTAVLAGNVYFQILYEQIPDWPFEGENPFPD